jgi:hypothetical protein
MSLNPELIRAIEILDRDDSAAPPTPATLGFHLTFRRWPRQFPGIFQRTGQPATPARRSAGPGPGGE